MRALFLIPSLDYPSSRFRIYQYKNHLESAGIRCKFIPASYGIFNRLRLSENTAGKALFYSNLFLRRTLEAISGFRYDVVLIQREIIPHIYPIIPVIIKRFNKNLVFDFDDAIWAYHTGRSDGVFNFLRYGRKIPKIIEMSKHVIVGNDLLKDYAVKYNENITVIPTPVDTDEYKIRDYSMKRSKVIVGWSGSQSTNPYLNMLTGVRKRLEKENNIEFRVISNNLKGVDYRRDTSFVPWRRQSEVDDLKELDIGIMPLPDTEWNRCKCNLKMIQYMALGIPTVCSPVGMNNEIVEECKTGFFAKTDDEWFEGISNLIEHPGLRREMGLSGRERVNKRYSVKVNSKKLVSALEKAALCD